jgi:hypothetical protein
VLGAPTYLRDKRAFVPNIGHFHIHGRQSTNLVGRCHGNQAVVIVFRVDLQNEPAVDHP